MDEEKERAGDDTHAFTHTHTHTLLDTFTHSVTAWCGWQELAAAGLVVCHRQCQRSTLWPEQLLLCETGEQFSSSFAISFHGSSFYWAQFEALTRTAINTSLTPRGSEKEEECRAREKRPDQYLRVKLQKSRLTLPFYQHWNYSQSMKLLTLRRIIPVSQEAGGSPVVSVWPLWGVSVVAQG